MRSYRKFTDVQEDLRQRILFLQHSGESRLEGERDLAVRFRTGRPTIAKALAQLEQEKLIERTRGGVRIVPFRQKFRYAYVATVHRINDTFWYLAYQHLWNELEKLAHRQNLKIDLVLYDPEQEHARSRLLEQLTQYEMIFLSLIGMFVEDSLADQLRKLKRSVIILDENIETEGFPLYALGNFETGSFAARILLERGYRKTAILAPGLNTSTCDFLGRINGFTSEMKKTGIFQLFAVHTYSEMEELNLMQRCINQLPGRGFDSIFFLDDKWIMLCSPLIESGLVPDFGILAFDGTMTARRHNPPIDTVSHGTIPLAEKICKIISEHESGHFQYEPSVRCRILPNYYRGKTLRAAARN